MDTDVTSSNGLPEDINEDPVVVDLRKRIEEARVEEQEIRSELAGVTDLITRYERAVRALTGEKVPGGPRGPKPKDSREERVRAKPSAVGPERLKLVEQAIREYAVDHEEFRQVDLRSQIDITSSQAATAFEMLRQQNVIRLARVSGNNKYFRLTREALNATAEKP